MPQPAAPRGRTGLPPVMLLASTSNKKFAEYEKRAEAGITCLGAENEEQYALYLDTIHWPFVLVYDKILCFSCTYLLFSFALFVCLIILEMVSNFAQVFST